MVCNKSEIDKIINDCEEYRLTLIQHCMTLLDYNESDAMDCVQEAYLELLIALQRGNEIKNYKAWLYKVTMNKRNQLLGETVQRKEVPIPDNISDADEVELTVHYNETEPVVTQEEIEKLSVEIIDNLSDNDRTLYLDIYVHRKKLKDIAMQREKGLYAIKKQHERLKKKLRKKITEKADKLY